MTRLQVATWSREAAAGPARGVRERTRGDRSSQGQHTAGIHDQQSGWDAEGEVGRAWNIQEPVMWTRRQGAGRAGGAGSEDWIPEEGGENGATCTAKKGDTLGTVWSSNHGESVGSHCALSSVPPERRADRAPS